MENRVYEQAAGTSAVVDEGLREYMLKVYNYMAGGLCVTALVAYLIANTSLLTLFFNISPDGRVLGMSALGWISLIAPLIIVFAFGWVLNRGTLAQVQGVFWLYSALMGASLTPIFLVYTSASLTRIFLITAAMFGALSLYGYTTKRNLAGMGSFMMMGLFGVIIAMIVNIFLKSPGLYYALSILSVIIFIVIKTVHLCRTVPWKKWLISVAAFAPAENPQYVSGTGRRRYCFTQSHCRRLGIVS